MAGRDEVIIISDSPSPPPPCSQPFAEELELELSGAEINRLLQQVSPNELALMPPVLRSDLPRAGHDDALSKCEEAVLACFPDICLKFLNSEAAKHDWDSQHLISHLLDEQEQGRQYPKQSSPLKRKRPEKDEVDVEEEARRRYEKAEPLVAKGREYIRLHIKAAHRLLKAAFPQRYAEDIEKLFKQHGYQLYPTYLALDMACWSPDAEPARVKKVGARRDHLEDILKDTVIEAEKDALEAFNAARTVCEAKAQARAEEKQKEEEEQENWERAKAEGTIAECGCCFDDKPLNRMVHCDGSVCHWFCRGCARLNAEHAIGLSKYQLTCMSVDGCDATFSRDQRKLFLDDKLTTALDLIEQETVLRLSGIENLATCPFCPYAAEYPPVDENKEFRCENPGCRLVSCRLCRQETHIPKSCSEASTERGLSARRAIEEAMSAALIRKCNKCGTPFIKENGCNKMTCSRPGCRNVQCYVCHRSCDYSHFDDSSRGGKKGNCPLFESVEERHQNEVKAAEEAARQKVAEENPDVNAEALTINFSDKVKQDDARRKVANPGPRRAWGPDPLEFDPLDWFAAPPPRPLNRPDLLNAADQDWVEPPPIPAPLPVWRNFGPPPYWAQDAAAEVARRVANAQPGQPAQRAQQGQPGPPELPAVQELRARHQEAVERAGRAAQAAVLIFGQDPVANHMPDFPPLQINNHADGPNRPGQAVPAPADAAPAVGPINPRQPADGGRDEPLARNDRFSILARASRLASAQVEDPHAAHARVVIRAAGLGDKVPDNLAIIERFQGGRTAAGIAAAQQYAAQRGGGHENNPQLGAAVPDRDPNPNWPAFQYHGPYQADDGWHLFQPGEGGN